MWLNFRGICSIRGYLSPNLIPRQKHILEELSLLLKLKTDTCMKLHSHEKMKKAHNPRKRAATNLMIHQYWWNNCYTYQNFKNRWQFVAHFRYCWINRFWRGIPFDIPIHFIDNQLANFTFRILFEKKGGHLLTWDMRLCVYAIRGTTRFTFTFLKDLHIRKHSENLSSRQNTRQINVKRFIFDKYFLKMYDV